MGTKESRSNRTRLRSQSLSSGCRVQTELSDSKATALNHYTTPPSKYTDKSVQADSVQSGYFFTELNLTPNKEKPGYVCLPSCLSTYLFRLSKLFAEIIILLKSQALSLWKLCECSGWKSPCIQAKKIKDCLKRQLKFINSMDLLNKHYWVHRPLSEGVCIEIPDKTAEFHKLFQKQHDPSIFDMSLKSEMQSSYCKLMQNGSYVSP